METSNAAKLMLDCHKLIKKYNWLADSFVIDFFTENIWDTKVPQSWKEALETAKPSDLANLLDYENQDLTHAWPLEIIALRTSVQHLAVPRKPITKDHLKKLLHPDITLSSTDEVEWQNYQEELSQAAGQHKGLEHVFRKHVKPKKQHEIARLCDVIRTVANSGNGVNVSNLVDIGSGLGHLSRLLSFGHGFKVTCVDAQSDLSTTADKFDAELMAVSKTEVGGQPRQPPQHVTLCIDNDLSAQNFQSTISGNEESDFGIVGLHTCGDLGPNLVRLFSGCDNAKFLISVGCCYMRLDKNFPLNDDLFQMSTPDDPEPLLTYSAKELACHAIEAFIDRLNNEDECNKLKVHCNRAVLEDLIVSRWSGKPHQPLKAVANSYALPFSEYAKRAIQNLELRFDESDLDSIDVEKKLNRWNQVLGFYTLRLLIAPVIEHLLLLDRFLNLQRSGFKSWILPVFDPKLSPRNHVLLAVKK